MSSTHGRGTDNIARYQRCIATSVILLVSSATFAACSIPLAELPHQGFDSLTAATDTSYSQSRHHTHDSALLSELKQLSPLVTSDGEKQDKQTPFKPVGSKPYKEASPPRLVDDFNINAIDASLEALLYTLCREANLTLRLHGKMDHKVTLLREGASLHRLLQDIAMQVAISWDLNEHQLEVWSDEPYLNSYSVNYLNIQRTVHSSLGLATQVGSINATQGVGHSIANSSKTRVENISQHAFWEAFEADIKQSISAIDGTVVGRKGVHESKFSLNAEAGLLNVYARPEVHQAIKRYLKLLHDNTSRQVRIEATVVEVVLSNEFQTGVDWQVLSANLSGINAAQVLSGLPEVTRNTIGRISAPNGLVSLVSESSVGNITATVNLLQQFGDVRILSRPRIIALNNQVSILKVVDNKVYFTTKVERTQSETNELTKTETEIHTVPVGLVMNVTPQISSDHSVMLNIRPSLSRIIGFVNDPNPELAQANVLNGVPEIQVREMETMLQVPSGKLAIIGGLMQETIEDGSTAIPGLATIPVLKHLFTQQKKRSRQTELLVVLRPTVISSYHE